jgi:hypothetical protein
MSEKKSDQILKWEEPYQYTITVEKAKNLLRIVFFGDLKKPGDVPNFINHHKEAVAAVEDDYLLLAEAKTPSPPGFGLTGLFKESHAVLLSKKIKKKAAVASKLIYKMVTKVTLKLSGMNAKVFDDTESAEKWLFEED